MQLAVMERTNNMGKLAKVSYDQELNAKISEFLTVVNTAPLKDAVLLHPFASNVKYIPVAVIENALTNVFQQWHIEVLREGQILNSVYCTIRLHLLHPVTGKWYFQDGVGAVAMQTKKGADPMDINAIQSNAVMLALPAAKSFALKDAAEHIGKLFGRDLNRKEDVAFKPQYGTYTEAAEQSSLVIPASAEQKKRIVVLLNDKLEVKPEQAAGYVKETYDVDMGSMTVDQAAAIIDSL